MEQRARGGFRYLPASLRAGLNLSGSVIQSWKATTAPSTQPQVLLGPRVNRRTFQLMMLSAISLIATRPAAGAERPLTADSSELVSGL
jgi:hypothetical protein